MAGKVCIFNANVKIEKFMVLKLKMHGIVFSSASVPNFLFQEKFVKVFQDLIVLGSTIST